ncbi:MAG: PEP-CTERM sorting domain-containing protein, partial [Nitrospira sp.]|nr:PEP-CTERM sorting domain-containing protein [Nitrospira sp.]
ALLGLMMAGIIPILGTSPAMALSINFTDGSWNGAHGQTSFTTHASGVDLAAAAPGTISVNYINGPSGDNSGMDGLGIGDDEITQSSIEQLTITFDGHVTLESVYLTDLFRNDGGLGMHEIGLYSINGGNTFTPFTAAIGQVNGITNGERTLALNLSGVNSITFKANSDNYSDYSVKGLKYSVAEPSTLLLLGFGFVVGAILYRRGYVPSV